MKIKAFLTVLTCGIFVGCSSINIEDFKDAKPELFHKSTLMEK